MYNSQYYTCEQIDQRLLQGYLDDYNTQTGQSLTKAQFLTKLGNIFSKEGVIDNIATQIGYYECDTVAGTAAKAITVANYDLFAGGSMKVKFVNKNTANNATLNINSQGAKALYYQGERASSTNSWDEGEVVEIYYDGTNYYANNVKGGSGSGVYDVSIEHPTSGPNEDGKFTLEYILNSSNVNELIPVNKRYPGMSIQFVSTSDHKYVQYRLMATTWSNYVSDWVNVEEREIQTEKTLDEVIPIIQNDNIVIGYQINASGIKAAKNERGYFIVKILGGSTELTINNGTVASLSWYSGIPDIDAGTNFVQRDTHSDLEDKIYPIPSSTCKYAIITLHLGYSYNNVSVEQDGQLASIVKEHSNDISEINTQIENINETVEGISEDVSEIQYKELVGKKVIFLGDSITAGNILTQHGYSLDDVYHKVFADLAGASEHVNLGVGGSTIATKTNASNQTANTNRFKYRVTAQNFAGADLVVVFGGVNDADQDAYPIGDLFTITEGTASGNWGGHAKVAPTIVNEGRSDEVAPFGAALHQLINLIYSVAPNVPILFITPLNSSYTDGSKRRPKSFEDNKNGDYMSDFREAIHKVCDFYSIPVFDAHLIPQLNFCNQVFSSQYSFDGLHPNVAGNKLIGTSLYKFVKDNIKLLNFILSYIGNIDFSELTTLFTVAKESIWVNIDYKGDNLYTTKATGVKYKANLEHSVSFVKINVSTGSYTVIETFTAMAGENIFNFTNEITLSENEYIGMKVATANSFSFSNNIDNSLGYGGFSGDFRQRTNYCFPYDVFIKEVE